MLSPLALLAFLPLALTPQSDGFARAMRAAEKSLDSESLDLALIKIEEALERDPRSLDAWRLRLLWGEKAENVDEQVYTLHRLIALAVAQEVPAAELEALRDRARAVDPYADELWSYAESFVRRLTPVAAQYEEEGRVHSAIQVHKIILALQPEHTASRVAIERLAASKPDPSLAADAEAEDLLAGISEEWIRDHDEKHASWGKRARLESEHYRVETNAGFEVLVRCAKAMDQMNAFYRRFFEFGLPGDKRSVPKIALMIFAERQEYLRKGTNTQQWSGGQFTGSSVETYAEGGMQSLFTTLFHEACHQFIDLTQPNASGWMNEGLASYFEGTRLLSNGAVLTNLPADHRLYPLVERMQLGWMEGPRDGIDPGNPEVVPEAAPTFRTVIENQYEWGPAWYAPTWGVVYFLQNYQDPHDGRFVYRQGFREFVNETGGKAGSGAVKSFEEVVLNNPEPRTPGVDFDLALRPVVLPQDTDELNAVWSEWLSDLALERAGSLVRERPYRQWGLNAVTRGRHDDAVELFEKGLLEDPHDPELLEAFGRVLAEHFDDADRGGRLCERALRIHESRTPVDEAAIARLDELLTQWDPGRVKLVKVRSDLWAYAANLVERHLYEGRNKMGMALAGRLSRRLERPQLLELYERGLRARGAPIAEWQRVYDEESLDGWSASVPGTYTAKGRTIDAVNGKYDPDNFDFRFLTLNRLTAGDFSLEASVLVNPGEVTFSGLAFGQKSSSTYHAVVLFPPKEGKKGASRQGFLDLASFFGTGSYKTWRHNPVATASDETATSSGWHTIRVDVTGRMVDLWYDGELIVSQEFPSRDTLTGTFGLITGAGRSAYRDIRFLPRPVGDRTGEIDRAFRLRDLTVADAVARDSWVGHAPPWLQADRWLQDERAGWRDRGAVPTLVAMWSIRQNKAIPIDAWLRHMKEQYADIGLEVLNVVSVEDEEAIGDYLESVDFPGALAVDTARRKGFGDTFELYGVGRTWQLPFLVLVDVDHKVVWQGEPGFQRGQPWAPGKGSYLDDPLNELIESRSLRELFAWRGRWTSEGLPALREARLQDAVPLMKEALSFGIVPDPEVVQAQALYATLETTLRNANASAQVFVAQSCDPVIKILVDCARSLDEPINLNRQPAVRLALKSNNTKAWSRALKTIAPLNRKVKTKNPWNTMDELLAKLDELPGAFVAQLRRDLAHCHETDDTEALAALLEGVERRPSDWLLEKHFGWSLGG